MTTEEIIADLRQNGLTSASIYTRMERAANRLEELQRANQELKTELNYALAELHQARGNTRPEPSRLEIAAMLLAALAGRESESWEAQLETIWAIEQADELIALAKEKK